MSVIPLIILRIEIQIMMNINLNLMKDIKEAEEEKAEVVETKETIINLEEEEVEEETIIIEEEGLKIKDREEVKTIIDLIEVTEIIEADSKMTLKIRIGGLRIPLLLII